MWCYIDIGDQWDWAVGRCYSWTTSWCPSLCGAKCHQSWPFCLLSVGLTLNWDLLCCITCRPIEHTCNLFWSLSPLCIEAFSDGLVIVSALSSLYRNASHCLMTGLVRPTHCLRNKDGQIGLRIFVSDELIIIQIFGYFNLEVNIYNKNHMYLPIFCIL